ncbi:hypothetical protein CVS30_17125 [Arthrobacter psychrolactophilus]|uniref:Uncharacterized protein n=1 Tax=Arthrobacter psychrolactophilus TaxID=92442 RepID=A0A2V5IK98_9MICC|nr:hypothetical protein [Arthrobacter psychrolactophilus]PYI37088.1 hypothetical protein CVS30_17125 [Arthrobacter psychrolactophilus]
MPTPGSALVGYAILRANYDAQAPAYLDNFTPFVLSAIANAKSTIVEREVVAKLINEMFGLNIPSLVIPRLLKRTNRGGLTELVGTGAVRLTPKALAELPDLASEVAQYQRRQAELVSQLAEYIGTHHPEHTDLTTGDLGAHLAEFFDKQAVPLLGNSLGRSSAIESGATGIQYIVSAFVTHLAKNDQSRFTYVVEAAKGAMLASVLELDTSSMHESLAQLTIALDTPLVMDALGYHGPDQHRSMEHVLQMAKRQGAVLGIFRHCMSELDGILEAIEGGLRRGSASRMTSSGYLHFAETGASPSDLALHRQRLEEDLEAAGIRILDRPGGYSDYGLDERKLEEKIESTVHYFQDAARVNDVHSLSAVHRLRRGDRSRTFEKCVAVLMTSNSNLVRGARDFHDESSFPLAVTAEAVASILWVRSPALAPDVPREMVLASAYVGMQPSPTFWSKYVDEVERLEKIGTFSPDDAMVLRSTRLGREALMLESLGEETAVERDLPAAVLERVHDTIADPLLTQVGQLKSQLAESEAVATHTSADWMNQVDARQRAEDIATEREAEIDALGSQLRQKEDDEHAKIARIIAHSKKVARRLTKVLTWTGRALILACAALAVVLILRSSEFSGSFLALITVACFVATFLPRTGAALVNLENNLAKVGGRRQLVIAGYDSAEADGLLNTHVGSTESLR